MAESTRAALVTGASTGIGLAVTKALAADGYAVTMVARKVERLEASAEKLRAEGHDVTSFVADVTEETSADAMVAAHLERYGRLDVAVANAGMGIAAPAADSRPRELNRMLAVNAGAGFALAAAAMPSLRDTAADGRRSWFIVLSSIAGIFPTAGLAGYSASKAAALSLARSVNAEESERGVRACAICPAFVDTDMTTWTHDSVPPETMLRADDVGETVRFLLRLSPNAAVSEIVLQRVGAPLYVA
jgi:NADP-dependent 3-hydroxy acid dehydrogenase YdfG